MPKIAMKSALSALFFDFWPGWLGARRRVGVDLRGGFVHLARHQQRPGFEAVGNALFNGLLLVAGRFFQYPAGDFAFIARMANAQAQPPVIATAQLGVDVAQAVVAAVAAALFSA